MNWAEVPMAANTGAPPFVRLGVIGHPVDHSLSPAMQQAALDHLGIPGEYLAIDVSEHELEPAIEHLKLCSLHGFNVTVPHKQHPHLLIYGDSIVQTIGAVNTVKFVPVNPGVPAAMHFPQSAIQRQISAINTDAQGFFTPIRDLRKGRALVLGAGGAAAAVAFALFKYGWEFCIWNRSSQAANDLAQKYGAEVRDEPSPKGCSLIINATSLGMNADEEPPLLWVDLSFGTTVYDLVYRQGPTDFLSHALLEGAAVIDGREMLVGQGAVSLNWWLGVDPPIDVMRKAVGL